MTDFARGKARLLHTNEDFGEFDLARGENAVAVSRTFDVWYKTRIAETPQSLG